MYNPSAIFLLFCLAGTSVSSHANEAVRIINGQVITIDKAPYTVSIQDEDGHFCGGTLVADRFVVTAAHCLNEVDVDDIVVVGGASTLSETGMRCKVARAFIPAAYDRDSLNMDVAVLKLNCDMRGTNIQPVELCSDPLNVGDMFQVSGWGLTHDNNTEPSHELRTIRVPILPKDKCVDVYKKGGETLTETMVCAAEVGFQDACQMDSGGPAISGGHLCGVVSWGMDCGDKDFPGIYTDVNKALGFIKKCMKS